MDDPKHKKSSPKSGDISSKKRHYHHRRKNYRSGNKKAGEDEQRKTEILTDKPEKIQQTLETVETNDLAAKEKGIRSAISKFFQNFTGKNDATVTNEGAAAITIDTRNMVPVTDDVSEAPKAEPAKSHQSPPPRRHQHKKPAGKPQQQQHKKPAGKPQQQQQKPASRASDKVKYKLLINTEEPEECRIALIENGKVESFHLETIVQAQTKGNIYKGKVITVESNLQAAFVDYGEGKNGFLPLSDIHPEYFNKEVSADIHWKDIDIADVLAKGQEVLVEVIKEPSGTKGATLTTYLSLPGRFLVLMPGSDSHGISRKLDDETREKLRKMINSFKIPDGIGYIVRTASGGVTKTALSKDLRFLLNLWKEVKERGQQRPAPSLLYKEQNIISRFLRDHFTPEISEILVDNHDTFKQVSTFIDLLPSRQKKPAVKLHKGSKPLFNQYNLEEQIEQIYQPSVKLPSGGSIVINPTEALVAIDVNSGRTSKDKNFEETIFLANLEAAEELARQLRLRDLGGLIVVDFIDMRSSRHTREVEKRVKESMKRDKAKMDISRISKFGLMQISRQRLGPPVQTGSYKMCEHCQGRGMVQTVETQALVYLRRIQTGVVRRNVQKVRCVFPLHVAQYLSNKKRVELAELERKHDVEIQVTGDQSMLPSQSVIEFS